MIDLLATFAMHLGLHKAWKWVCAEKPLSDDKEK